MLRIRSLRHLAQRTCLSVDFLQRLHETHSRHYTVAQRLIGKKRRTIFDPDRELRSALVPIKRLLAEVPLPDPIVGGRQGGSLRQFALPHVRQALVVEFDVADFYPSTKVKWVYNLFCDDLCCSPDVARVLTRLTTARGHLPQGFNTSTHIGNLLLAAQVSHLSSFAEGRGGRVTVWVDNIVVSGPSCLVDALQSMNEILRRTGYQFHAPRVMPSSRPQIVCGVTVNANCSKEKRYREQIAASIREILEGNMCAVCGEFADAARMRDNLLARIRHVGQINIGQQMSLHRLFQELDVDWGCRCGP